MAVITAKIQTVEDICALLRAAVLTKQPVGAFYDGRYRKLCPHRLGRNKEKRLRALCYQYGGGSESGLQPGTSETNWPCISVEKLSRVQLVGEPWQTAPNHSRPKTCVFDVDVEAAG